MMMVCLKVEKRPLVVFGIIICTTVSVSDNATINTGQCIPWLYYLLYMDILGKITMQL